MVDDLIPTQSLKQTVILDVSPTDESKALLSVLFRRSLEFQEKLREKQEENLSDYSISSVDVTSYNTVPQRTKREICRRSMSQWKTIYEKDLFDDYSLLESYNKYLGNTKYYGNILLLSPDEVETTENQIIINILDEEIILNIDEGSPPPTVKDWEDIRLRYTEPQIVQSNDHPRKTGLHTEWCFTFENSNRIYSDKEDDRSKIVGDVIQLSADPAISVAARVINNGYFVSEVAKRILLLLNSDSRSIFLKYTFNAPQIIKAIIKNFDLNYCYVPQKGRVIISQKEMPFEKDYFVKNFPQKQKLTDEEAITILKFLEVPESTIQRLKEHRTFYDLEKMDLEELELLGKLREERKLSNYDVDCYKYSYLYSDGTRKSMLEIIEKGRKRRKELEKLADDNDDIQDIIESIDDGLHMSRSGYRSLEVFSQEK